MRSQNAGNGSDAKHHLVRGSANCTWQAGPILVKFYWNIATLIHLPVVSGLPPLYGSRVELLKQRLYGLQSQKYLLADSLRKCLPGFPGGAVVENSPSNAGDTGLIPGPGRSHMPRSNRAHAPQLLRLCSRASAPQLPSLRAATRESSQEQQRRPKTAKNK